MNPSADNNLEHHSTGVPLFDRLNRNLLERISKLESDVASGMSITPSGRESAS